MSLSGICRKKPPVFEEDTDDELPRPPPKQRKQPISKQKQQGSKEQQLFVSNALDQLDDEAPNMERVATGLQDGVTT